LQGKNGVNNTFSHALYIGPLQRISFPVQPGILSCEQAQPFGDTDIAMSYMWRFLPTGFRSQDGNFDVAVAAPAVLARPP
jgi:hypothetical protein